MKTVLRCAFDVLRGFVMALLLYYAVYVLILNDVGGLIVRYAGY